MRLIGIEIVERPHTHTWGHAALGELRVPPEGPYWDWHATLRYVEEDVEYSDSICDEYEERECVLTSAFRSW